MAAILVVLFGFLLFSSLQAETTEINLSKGKPKPNKGCPLEIFLIDKWGDGWSGAKLTVSSGGPKDRSFSPKPKSSGTSVNVALSPLSPSTIYVSPAKSGQTKESWEIWWSFSVDGTPYIGGYDTVITLECLWESPKDWVIQVKEVKNAEEPSCSRCSKPKPKPKPSKTIKKEDGGELLYYDGSNGAELTVEVSAAELNSTEYTMASTVTYQQAVNAAELEAAIEDITEDSIEEGSSAVTDVSSVSTSSESSFVAFPFSGIMQRKVLSDESLPKPKPSPKKKYPYVAMLLNTAGHGWYDGTGLSTYYSISDSSRYELYGYGTMCGSFSEQLCEERLPDGDYVLRVGGNGDTNHDDNTWEFCGVTGGPQQELSFSVKKGKCEASTTIVTPYDPKPGATTSSADDIEPPDVTDDDFVGLKSDVEMPLIRGFSQRTASVMVFTSAAIGCFVIGFIAVNAIVAYHIRSSMLKKQAQVISTEITNEKLLAANGLTIIKESDMNSSRHKLVSSLDL